MKETPETLLELHQKAGASSFWQSNEFFILFAVFFLLAFALFIWAAYIRRPRKISIPPHFRVASRKADSPPGRQGDRRRRRRRRNPTLSETGGLPPTRDANAFSDSR